MANLQKFTYRKIVFDQSVQRKQNVLSTAPVTFYDIEWGQFSKNIPIKKTV